MRWLGLKLQVVLPGDQMGVMCFQELVKVQANVVGDLIYENKGGKVHKNVKSRVLD